MRAMTKPTMTKRLIPPRTNPEIKPEGLSPPVGMVGGGEMVPRSWAKTMVGRSKMDREITREKRNFFISQNSKVLVLLSFEL